MSQPGEEPLTTWGSGTQASRASRAGDVVLRAAGPWTSSVHALLRHLEDVGFTGAPRVLGTGFDPDGRETVEYLPGWSPHPHAWHDEGVHGVGALLRSAHEAARTFVPPADARWQTWWGRQLGRGGVGIGHCDAGPWNIVAVDGMPTGLVDWEFAGPVDPYWDVVQAAWLNAQLHDEDTAHRWGLPDADRRADQLALLLDGYGLPRSQRAGFVDDLVEFAVRDAASEARDRRVHPESTEAVAADGYPVLWAVTWRTLSADWILRHRDVLRRAIT